MSDTFLRDAALALASAGWEVLPCSSEDKAPLIGGGHKNASQSADLIELWWTRWPRAIIGVCVPDGVVVLDIDPRNGGSYEILTEAVGPLPPTLTVTSGRGDGGQHLYYTIPEGSGHFTNRNLPKGIDVKVNGYMIVPPSPHPLTGNPYVANGPFIAHGLPELPARAVEVLTPPPPPYAHRIGSGNLNADSVQPLADTVRNAAPGERNVLLYWAACCVYAEAGSDITACLVAIARAARHAGLDDVEIQRTIRSAEKKVRG